MDFTPTRPLHTHRRALSFFLGGLTEEWRNLCNRLIVLHWVAIFQEEVDELARLRRLHRPVRAQLLHKCQHLQQAKG